MDNRMWLAWHARIAWPLQDAWVRLKWAARRAVIRVRLAWLRNA